MTSRSEDAGRGGRARSLVVADRQLDQLGGHRLALHVEPVVRPLRVQWPSGTPLATAVVAGGHVEAEREVALSRGWSLEEEDSARRRLAGGGGPVRGG